MLEDLLEGFTQRRIGFCFTFNQIQQERSDHALHLSFSLSDWLEFLEEQKVATISGNQSLPCQDKTDIYCIMDTHMYTNREPLILHVVSLICSLIIHTHTHTLTHARGVVLMSVKHWQDPELLCLAQELTLTQT